MRGAGLSQLRVRGRWDGRRPVREARRVSLHLVVIGLFIILYQSRNHRGVEPSVYAPGREWSPSTAIDSEDTYSEADDIDVNCFGA